MEKYKIKYIPQPSDDSSNSASELKSDTGIKESFWDNNLSMSVCIAMILNKNIDEIKKKNPHYILYGKYLGGFLFESYDLIPPLCILNVVFNNKPHNSVYYNHTIYDPKLGVFSDHDYRKNDIHILSYIQIFIEEAYNVINWRPPVPQEIRDEFEKDAELQNYFDGLSPVQQSKILNYIYPFSKASSLNEKRKCTQRLKIKQVESIVGHIKTMIQVKYDTQKSVWDELHDFETIEAVDTLKKCGLAKGMTVLDMGCGHGHYSIPASIAVEKTGHIIAVDLSKKVIKEAEKRTSVLNINNITFRNTDENGLDDLNNKIDFLILYDVLHGIEWRENKNEKMNILNSLLKSSGILSLALYNEIEQKPDPSKKLTPKGFISTIIISHEEAIQPYIKLIESCGFILKNIVENGGVHFDNFHSPYHWKKYGEVRICSLERRPIYNFIKI